MEYLLDTWLEATEQIDGRKTLRRATEMIGQRTEVLDELTLRTRAHYVSDIEIATFLEALDYPEAAEVVRENYPQGAKGRSGDLGEILCTEVIEEWCGFDVPIRKLRYKDHREQAMRGEDVIGVRQEDTGDLSLLKAEAKSAQALATQTVVEARQGLDANSGRPSGHAMMYVGRRLLEQGGASAELGKKILAESARQAVPKTRISHFFFAMTGSAAGEMIDNDFEQAEAGRNQIVVHLRIPEHADFVEEVYNKVNDRALN
jgi:hypothetical protein